MTTETDNTAIDATPAIKYLLERKASKTLDEEGAAGVAALFAKITPEERVATMYRMNDILEPRELSSWQMLLQKTEGYHDTFLEAVKWLEEQGPVA